MSFNRTTWTEDCSDRPGLKMLAAIAAAGKGHPPKHHRALRPSKTARPTTVVHVVVHTSKLPAGFQAPKPPRL